MALNKITQKKWTYTLYESDGIYLLSVVCGSVAMYELNISLNYDDAQKAISDSGYLEKLALEIACNPHQFLLQSVHI